MAGVHTNHKPPPLEPHHSTERRNAWSPKTKKSMIEIETKIKQRSQKHKKHMTVWTVHVSHGESQPFLCDALSPQRPERAPRCSTFSSVLLSPRPAASVRHQQQGAALPFRGQKSVERPRAANPAVSLRAWSWARS